MKKFVIFFFLFALTITSSKVSAENGNTFNNNQETKSEDLYKETIKKYKQAIKERWSYSRMKQENFTTVSQLLLNKRTSLKKVGYAFYDVNSDGIDELFVGKINKSNGRIYSVFTIVNGKPEHITSMNYPEDELFVCNDNFLCKESHIAKDKYIKTVRVLKKNSHNLKYQVEYMYNPRLDSENPWFTRFESDEKYQKISENEYNQGIHAFDNYKKLNYTPLSKFDF